MTGTAEPKVRPNLFIVGAPKCGTTSLYEYLKSHPEVFMSVNKEPTYWSNDVSRGPGDIYIIEKPEDYFALFEDAAPSHRVVGEASTPYIYSKVAVERILEFSPEARFIAMLRSPVDLFVSLHQQQLRGYRGFENDIEKAWRNQEEWCRIAPEGMVYHYDYRWVCALGTHMERLMGQVAAENLHIILLDDLKEDPLKVYLKTLAFLGLKDDGRRSFPVYNESRIPRIWAYQWLIHFGMLKLGPVYRGAKWLAHRMGIRDVRGRLTEPNLKRVPKPDLRPEFREELVECFRPQVDLLSRLLDRDLSHWLDMPDDDQPAT